MPAEKTKWLVYGAYGFTGQLVVAEAKRKRQSPVIAGRDQAKLDSMGSGEGLESRRFSLEEPFDEMLDDIAAVLHCAGPFSRTSRPMVDACLRTGTHYLDVTGEIGVFESIFDRNEEAIETNVSLIPGVGFDVVPTDCLAARLAAEIPNATGLDLAFSMRRGGISRGTLKTMIDGIGDGGAIRRDGQIVPVPFAWDVREIPFESGPRTAMTIPWGDVSTAYHTTGIPNIRVYSSVSPRSVRRYRIMRPFLPIAALPPVKWMLLKLADRQSGPDAEQRGHSWIDLWGEAWNDSGERASRAMRVPEGYTFTAASAVLAIEAVLRGVPPGAHTPAGVFGADFVDRVIASLDR